VHIAFPLPPGEGWGEGENSCKIPLILSFSRKEKGLSRYHRAHYLPFSSVTRMSIAHSGATGRASHQLVPNPTATALLLEVALLGQHPEVLFQRVATRAGQPNNIAHRGPAVLARELDDL